ncbi:MAG: helix-turn-helix domain-containing protein [Gammaproteobacteria bacterium]
MIKKIQSLEAREKFYEQLANNQLTLAETIKAMRAIVGMTQPEYAEFVGVAPRIISDLERGIGNPTLTTLKKIGKPFRLQIIYFYKREDSAK